MVRPACFGTFGSVRVMTMPKSRVVRARGPDLLAVDHPVVAVALGLGADAGHVGPGGRLGEELAPHFLAVQRGLHVALQMLGLA